MEVNAMETASRIDMGLVRGVIAALTMAVFLGIAWWAYHRGNRQRFEEAARIPFDEDDSIQTLEREGDQE